MMNIYHPHHKGVSETRRVFALKGRGRAALGIPEALSRPRQEDRVSSIKPMYSAGCWSQGETVKPAQLPHHDASARG